MAQLPHQQNQCPESDVTGSVAFSLRSWSPGESSQSDTEERSGMAAHMQRLHWARADSSDFCSQPPSRRCGHIAVGVGHSKVVFFGGFADERCLDDIFVYDIERRLWYTPECIGSGSDKQAGPCPRAFHVAVTISSKMFIYGGRTELLSLGDLWVLDTAIWQWSEIKSFGDLPCPREFSAAAVIRNNKILIYGGWDGKNCLSDLYLLDTLSLEWQKIAVAGLVPPPRCRHSLTVIDKMLVIFGGNGVTKSSVLDDAWALNGINEEDASEREPTWTQLRLPGPSMHALSGHSMTSGRQHLLLFGGSGTEGWHDECIILHRGTQWTSLQASNEPPPPRSYHSMTCIGPRFLLFGGFDGKYILGDIWWLVIEGDPNIDLDKNYYAKLSALKDMLGADMDSISVSGSCSLRIDSYIYKHFQQILLMAWFSWRNKTFHDMHILPPPQWQLQGDCAYHATNTVIECHFKMVYASRPPGQVREFHVRLSHLHLKQMVCEYLSSEEGKDARLSDKLAICLLMAKRHGIVSEEDWDAGCPPQAVRYKIKAFRELSDVQKKKIPDLLRKCEMILTSFKVTSEYLDLLPHDIYRYRAPDCHNGVTDLHQGHCVVLTSTGYEFKEPDATDADDLEQSAEIEPPETYFEYVNSYTSGWGVDGSGFIYEESIRKTYRIKVVDM